MQRPEWEEFQTQEGEALRISILAFCCLIFTWEPRCIVGHRGLLSECLKAFLPTQMELDSRRAHATRSALILAHGSLALRASKEQLLARLEGRCIVGHRGLLSECLKAFLPTQMELDSRRAHATRSALILAHGSLALRASKEQLLARLEGDIVGNILLLYSCSCRVRARSVPGCLSTQLQPLHVGGC